ncbi:hypothetical protein GCM10010965_20980 [Caldalkalibacillus thermarum]|uniref:TerC family protein n=1 Tax=Caldalkalibacillus thermarum TaxID=296745 RepID=UPI001663AD60|nr:TerC family protein [Caldalkalibacillus thermarum]GGK27951.1 hypothetical protein GCM10010965_20980 [Caldalkalibacillus thermarum]
MEWWLLAFIKIVFINMILSGDNAIVIAMASRNLPETKRRLAIFWGAFGAIALRVILTVVAIQLLNIPFLMASGALLLLWVAIKLLADQEQEKDIQASNVLLTVVMTIMMADFIMSLDNVVAIAAVAKGDLLLIILGLILSIPIIIWGSHLVLGLLDRYPVFLYLGAAILGFTAGEMVLEDQKVSPWLESVWPFPHWGLPVSLAVLVIGIGHISKNGKTCY